VTPVRKQVVKPGMLFGGGAGLMRVVRPSQFDSGWWCNGVREKVGKWVYGEKFILNNRVPTHRKRPS
jgi:hypothetical protein